MAQPTYQDLLDAYAGRAGLLSRCILRGIAEPDGEINGDIRLALVEEMVGSLADIAENDSPQGFVRCLTRAYQWAVRPDTPPEFGILLGTLTESGPLTLLDGEARQEFEQSPAYRAYHAAYGEIIALARSPEFTADAS